MWDMRAVLIFTALAVVPFTAADTCAWQTCPSYDERPGVLNVHVVPHSHDDLGWLKTADEYYWGAKLRTSGNIVQVIYNTVIDALERDGSRRFTFAETGFMWRWMVTHNVTDQQRFINLVKKGQIEIIGGGWVQPDEAAAHYMAVLDEHTLGLRYLNQWFGQCGSPVTGWQIDPFGHSREIANLHALMGYKSLYFARLHYLERQARYNSKSLDMTWQTSADLKTSIQTGSFWRHYSAPDGLCWDIDCGDDSIVDDTVLEGYNVPAIVEKFAAYSRQQAQNYKSSHIMLTFGDDFNYQDAFWYFINLDKLIKYTNANSSLNIRTFYSTPSCYTQAVARLASPLPTKNTDFFPYASGQHSYWTGYFTSRPAHKLVVRRSNAFLQLARQLTVFANLSPSNDSSSLGLLDRASGLAQHHDSVTGTAREDVTRDYILQLSAGVQASAKDILSTATTSLSGKSASPLVYCTLLNETSCPGIQNLASFSAIVYNTLGQSRTTVVRVPFWKSSATVKDANGATLPSQVVSALSGSQWPTVGDARAPNELLVKLTIPAAGFASFSVTSTGPAETVAARVRDVSKAGWGSTSIENDKLKVQLSDDGLVQSVLDKATGKSYNLRQLPSYYIGASSSPQSSGAYVFRPDPSQARVDLTAATSIQTVTGALSNEIRQQFSPWISQVVRLDDGDNFVTFDWLVGPIEKETLNPVTKEVVFRYSTDVNGVDTFYTDASGRQTIQRKRSFAADFQWDDAETIAGNYYPITTRIHIADAQNAFGVITDRSQGGTAYNNTIELMVHRRCFHDDGYGVSEALNEPGTDGRGLVARGQHRVFFGSPFDVLERTQQESQRVFHAPELAFSTSAVSASFAGLKSDLPPEIHIATLDQLAGGDVLLRLEHVGESAANFGRSQSITVNVQNLFTKLNIVSSTELALGGDRPPLTVLDESLRANRVADRERLDLTSVTFTPQQIRTFRLTVSRN